MVTLLSLCLICVAAIILIPVVLLIVGLPFLVLLALLPWLLRIAGVVLLFGIQFQKCNAALLTGIVCGLWGILWGSLLIQNRNLVSKNV